MKFQFHTTFLNPDGSTKTYDSRDVKGLVSICEDDTYTYEEISDIANKAIKLERGPYGWSVSYKDDKDVMKQVFIRANTVDKGNATTSQKQSVQGWIDYIFDRQIALF